MNSATENKSCTCGNCPAIRLARGLAPFCQMVAPVREVRNDWQPFEAAQASNPGLVIVGRRGGMGHGPMRFGVKLNGLGQPCRLAEVK